MLSMLFGWRKASKCKKVIKEAQCRLKLLKIKRNSIVKYLREDTAHLIKTGHEDIALTRAEQLIKDESVAVAYELIDNFFDFVRTHFKYIRRHKDCPDDIKEAVSSLIYASARCGDLPELRAMRELFEDRYGHKLVMASVELYPGNLVNHQIKEALNTKFVSDDMKFRMVNEIATDYCLQRRLLALEYIPDWKQQENKEMNVEATSRSSSFLESSPGSADETTTLVYLDDVEEFPSSLKDDEGSRNGTIFKFKSPSLTKRSTASFDLRSSPESYWTEDRSSLSPDSSSIRSNSTNSRKRIRRRSVCLENSEAYYDLPRKNRSSWPTRSKRLDFKCSDSESGSDYSAAMMVVPRRVVGEFRRAETMPVERSKKSFRRDEFQRSNSCPVQDHPLHVHPKLPDYDELTATFLALRKEFRLNSFQC